VLVALENLDEAQVAIEEALEIDPDDPFLVSRLAFVALQQGRTKDAIGHLEHAAALDPDEGSYQADLGGYLVLSGDYGRAIEHFERAREMGEDGIIVIEGLSTALMGIGDLDQARVVLDAGMEAHPNSAELQAKVGDLLMLEDRCEEAIAEYDRALRKDPTSEHALAGRELCESILNPEPTPTPAPAVGTALSHGTARELAAGVVQQAGGTLLDALVDTSSGAAMWAVGYVTQHTAGSAEFNAQQGQIVSGLSRLVARLDPPVVGLAVVAINSSSEAVNVVGVATEIAKLWLAGRLSDEEFIDLWYIETP
jgi:Flp pilus assembly protein TadD